jgi:hypothetical protein
MALADSFLHYVTSVDFNPKEAIPETAVERLVTE